VAEHPRQVRLTRLGLARVEFEADRDFPDDAVDVKLVIEFGEGVPGNGSYARAAARRPVAAGIQVEALLTALDPHDAERLTAVVAGAPSSGSDSLRSRRP
jgi:hypothetical protein